MNEVVTTKFQDITARDGLSQDVQVYAASKMSWATPEEVKYFLSVALGRGLNPLANQIHAVPRKKKENNQYVTVLEIQTGIDGFRLIAERSEHYAGQVGPFWCGHDGVWKDVWLDSKPPRAAKVGVLKNTFKEPLYAIALWDSYVQTTYSGEINSMWKKMGSGQLAKCAEALALRKAFPEQIGGIYTNDELGQSDKDREDDKPPREVSAPKPASEKKISPPPFIPNMADVGGSMFTFGPYAMKPLNSINPHDLDEYLIQLETELKTKGRAKPAWLQEADKVSAAWLNICMTLPMGGATKPDQPDPQAQSQNA